MEVNVRKKKFKELFEKLFVPGFELNNNAYDELIKHLEQSEDKSILDTPFFSDLMLSSLANLHTVTNSVKVFVLKVLTISLKNELQFSKLVQMKGFHILAQFMQHTDLNSSELMYTCIMLATAQTSHYSGIMWLVEFKIWHQLTRPSVYPQTNKVANAACTFISKFVWKLDEYGEEAILTEVLAHIIEPIKNSKYMKIDEINTDNERELYEPIMPQINSLIAIVKDFDKYKNNNIIFMLLWRYFILQGHIHALLPITQSQELISKISELNILFVLGYCKSTVNLGRDTSEIPNEILSEYYNINMNLLMKRMTTVAINFCVKCVIIWDKADTRFCDSVFERHGRMFEMRNQFIPLVVTSVLTYAFSIVTEQKHKDTLEALNGYLLKEGSIISEHVVKASYAVRNNTEMGDMKKIVIYNLKELFKLRDCLNLSQAGMVYQVLFYLLQLHVTSDGAGDIILNENPLKSSEDIQILSLTLENIKMIIKEHNINWYESLEIICLQQALMNLLKQNFMSKRQLLQTIDLIDISIRRFISPEMALLMETKSGSSLTEVCSIMRSYIQHEEWEVRDSALQLLYSCLEVAFVKYIPLQKLISENGLVILAAKVALEDEEFYVQTMALRCLASATKIQTIWREVVASNNQLCAQLIYMLRHNTEDIVRKEVANILKEVYINQKLNRHFQTYLLNVMCDAAINDTHWEVQIVALNFWKTVIQNSMSDRGMIDGKFPSVTFSKEKRKIVVLNAKEIKSQLQGMMKDLASNGCLTVLYECLNGDFSSSVMEKAYRIAKELVEKLEFYKFEFDDELDSKIDEIVQDEEMKEFIVENDNTDEAMDLSFPTRTQIEHREEVIDDILNEDFCDLIEKCYNYSQIKSNPKEKVLPKPLVNVISPREFLRYFKSINYSAEIEKRRKWLSKPSTLDEILDEVLLLLEVTNNHNEMNFCV